MAEKKRKITSTEIKIALSKMHERRRSYFITECKTCSTYFPDPQGLLIFDGLAITKSYTQPNIVGYEIKVSRNDFLQDAKWHLYLQYCNEFFFVVPKGLIRKEELPENTGLIYYDPDTGGLRTVKKSLYRQIEEPVGLYKYIIFSKLDEDRIPFYEDRAEYARDYLEDKKDKKYVGYSLGSKLAKDVEAAYNRLEKLQREESCIDQWKQVEKVLRKHDILGWSWHKKESWLEDLDKALSGSYPKELEYTLEALKREVIRLERMKKEYEDGKGGVSGD